MWRVYKHTGTDNDYDAYKEALNAATNEVRKSKRNFEHKLAENIKSDSKSFYAYVRSKQTVRDKVGQLEDNAGNIITHTCQLSVIMTESPSFSSRQDLRPRRRKSPSFEHRLFSVFFSFSGHNFVFSSYNSDEWVKKQAMAHRRSGSPCAGNARKKKVYEAHVNPDWLNEWPALIAKSHKGDTDAFCRLCRCDFSVSSGESKTYSVTSLIITRCHH